MIYLLIALVVLGAIAAFVSLWNGGDDDGYASPDAAQCGACTGDNIRCEHECMLEAAVKDVEYYDDEELDGFRGRPSAGYTDEEVQQFAEVLYTLRPEEVRGWSRSLQLRGVNVPDQLKDELIMLIER